ncbi:thiazole biosynthesis adenylyltransferase ThiF [Paenibacillus dakarensis]|uniref:thiazole biosynthesis adenylyltransferase ThiF n=1 Tax=Paenibacillus dakarensis TaxID=1527293 RepID=UPI0006D576A7|nr:thiazole biosynthesis adenylyltransferase ThiF [Paenibacillus dakarensis]
MDQDRYSRQLLFRKIGEEGQRRLMDSHVLVIGAGALGTGSAEILVRAGVGTLTILDRDYVEYSNLQRQQLYAESDAKGRIPKAVAARQRLSEINSEVDIRAHVMDATAEELRELAPDVDLMIDATDNFETRLVINDISQKYNVPWIYGACVGSYGISYMVIPGKTPCLNCLLNSVPLGGATCDTAGIIAPAVHMVVAYQAAEALKWLTGNHDALRGELVSFDVWTNQHTSIRVNRLKRSDCPSCGDRAAYPYLFQQPLSKAAVLCGRDTVQIRPPHRVERDLEQLAAMLSMQGGLVEANSFLVSFSLGEHRMVFFRDGRVLVHGTSDIAQAKSLYHRYLG